MSTARQIAANQLNAALSTGPRSSEGKATSSQNNCKFGLTGNSFIVLSWEKQEEFEELRKNLIAEHQPSTATEKHLVEQMARHSWLSLRAGLLQEFCFRPDYPVCDQQQKLTLYLRYQTMHERAFQKALNELLKLRAERRKVEIGFESQERKRNEEARKRVGESSKREMHEARLRLMNARLAVLHARIPPNVPAHSAPKTRHEAAHREAA